MKQWMIHWNNKLRARAKKEEGVTLIELLAVIVILAVIAVVAIPVVTGSITRSKESVTQQNMAIIIDALNRYQQNNNGEYPKQPTLGDISGIATYLTSPDANNNKLAYLQAVPKDGWGNNYSYGSSNGAVFALETNTVTGQSPESWWVNSSMANPSNASGAPSTAP